MNILYLVHRAPYPPDKGDRIRSYHLLRYLRSLGNVSLATLADGPVDGRCRDELKKLTHRLKIVQLGRSRWIRGGLSLMKGRSLSEGIFASHSLRQTMRQWCEETPFDAAVCFCSSVFSLLPLELLREAAVVCDLVDVDSEKFFQYAGTAQLPKRLLYRTEGKRLRNHESRIGSRADLMLLTTEPEADLYRSFQPNANVMAIPNGVRADYFASIPRTNLSSDCVFVGELNYPPNEEAVVWFAKSIWPSVRTRCPASRFRIVGRGPTPAVEALRSIEGVDVVGAVPDVRPYLAEATVSVAPLRVARGVQNKVLEAMSMSRGVVASPDAAVGLGVTAGHHLLIARSPDEWINQVSTLLENPERADALGSAGRQYVLDFHVWDHCLRPLGDSLRQIRALKRGRKLARKGAAA